MKNDKTTSTKEQSVQIKEFKTLLSKHVKLNLMDSEIKDFFDTVKKEGKLPKAFKNKWLKALKSGDYKQGHAALKYVHQAYEGMTRETTYCCLGVACHIEGVTGLKDKNYIINEGQHCRLNHITRVPKLLRGNGIVPETLARINDHSDSYDVVILFIEKYL